MAGKGEHTGYSHKLTKKQKIFADIYDGNAKQAALLAGYSKVSAHSIGQRLLNNPRIKELIQNRNNKVTAPLIMNRQARQEFWSKVIQDPEQSMGDRLRASELLGRSEADFTENHKHSGDLIIKYGHRTGNRIADLTVRN
jgi:phage terminase small subunit